MTVSENSARQRALKHLAQYGYGGSFLSWIGGAMFPDHQARTRQGLALAASRIVRKMRDDGHVTFNEEGNYTITQKGRDWLAENP